MDTVIEANGQIDDPSVEDFITTYVENLIEGTAAIFAGAGLSKPAGFVDWQDLLSPIARSIGLDSRRERDLVAIAQYHLNEKLGNRHALTQILVENFSKTSCQTKNHEILCQLPIDTYWTTNYDKIIEQCLEKYSHIVDIKRDPADMTLTMPRKTATVYKMHGDINYPAKTILTKDEYLRYPRDNSAFLTALQYDLSRKSFLFIGFSFSDPNLESILNTIRLVHGPNSRPHYAFFKIISLKDHYSEEKIKDLADDKKAEQKKYAEREVAYQERKQELMLKDLIRFNINSVMIREYSDITRILERIFQRYTERTAQRKRTNTVYISGCADIYGAFSDADKFLEKLTIALLDRDCMIISDRTPGVGTNILATAAQYACYKGNKSISEYVISTPPLGIMSQDDLDKIRKSLIKKARFTIFLFGNSYNISESMDPIMNEEFLIAEECRSVIIPIGATGFSAYILWQRVISQLEKYYQENGIKMLPLIGLIEKNTIPIDDIINTVIKIIDIHKSI